jgi:hypothetical protein
MAIRRTWITLEPMGKGNHTRPRTTRELDAVKLAALAKESKATSHDEPVIAVGRTTTLDDPFTTGLLAEVTRQTQEFEPDVIEEVLCSLDDLEDDGQRHPNTRRRSG